MQKAEQQRQNVQSQPASRRGRGLAMASPQSEQIAQLEAMIDTSPAVTAQRKFVDGIHNSPRQAAQRKKLGGLFGGNAAQLNALAYAQRSDIHIAPGQEQHLPSVVAQRKEIESGIDGLTHTVRKNKGSLFNGVEVDEVTDKDELVIETEDKLRSRRGPNQELFRGVDEGGKPVYRWFRVLQVNLKDYRGDEVYIRDETLNLSPEAKGGRATVIDGGQRDRVEFNETPSLKQMGINNSGQLEAWLRGKMSEMDNIALAHYEEIDKGNQAFGITDKVDVDKRTGQCGETCDAISAYIKTNYPPIWAVMSKYTYPGGVHYTLRFDLGDGSPIEVDATYRQFDKGNKFLAPIWVGKPDEHPLKDEIIK